MTHRPSWLQLGLAALIAATCVSGASAQDSPDASRRGSLCVVVTLEPEGAETEYIAANFDDFREARRFARRYRSDARVEFLSGTCADQTTFCTFIYAPVCAVLNYSAETTFGNSCELRAATIEAAGSTLRASSAILHPGECGRECASSDECADGEYCTTEDGACNPPPGCEPGSTCITLCYGVCEAEPPASEYYDCDTTHAACRRLPPVCPEGQTASIEGICYGPCVPIEQCACSPDVPTACPEDYACWAFAGHCGPYVN